MHEFDLIAIGDTTLDIFLEIEDASINCELERETCKLILNYADKIPVKAMTRIPGAGNSANNAVGSSRLGLKSAIYTIVGNDSTGLEIIQNFKNEHVGTDYIEIDSNHGTNHSTVINFQKERTILVYHEPRTYDLPDLPASKWVYYSSVAKSHASLHKQIPEYIEKTKAKLAFNPGTFQILEGLTPEGELEIIKLSHIFFVNKEEAEHILGVTGEVTELIPQLLELGPNFVIVTDGPNGAYGGDGQKIYFQKILDGEIVERTGAGDAFASAVICALNYGASFPESLRWGTVNSGSVLKYVGPQKGLLTKDELMAVLSQNLDLQPEEVK